MEERTESATREGMRVRRRAGKERRVKGVFRGMNQTDPGCFLNDGQGLENRMGKQYKFGQSEDAVRSG